MSNSFSNTRYRIPRPQVCEPPLPPDPSPATACYLNHAADTIETGMEATNKFTHAFVVGEETEEYQLFVTGGELQVEYEQTGENNTPADLLFTSNGTTGSWDIVVTGVRSNGDACSKEWNVTVVDPEETEEEEEEEVDEEPE